MDYRNLGNSGLKVSTLCLGTMTFGEADETSFMHGIGCDEATAYAIMNRALDGGVNFIDTADVYGQDGLSEQVIGRWFEREKRRDEVVLATKFRFTMGQGPNASGASRYRILRPEAFLDREGRLAAGAQHRSLCHPSDERRRVPRALGRARAHIL
jgi:aryl-alcohol dehydrogenase-like predicted oxidoreductase